MSQLTQPSNLDLLPTEFEEDARTTVRALLAERCEPSAVTAMYDGDRAIVAPLWRTLAQELGLAGLLVPEAHGGAGATVREAAAVAEELGRGAAPVPFLTSAVVATTALLGADTEAGAELLGALAAGERTAALVVPFSTAPDDALAPLDLTDGAVSGTVTSVAGAVEADVLLVLVDTGSGIALAMVEAGAASVQPVVSLDMSRQIADVVLDGAAATIVHAGGEPAVRRALLTGAAVLASEQAGVARWCLEETLAYLKVRTQFGRVVGGFQAIKHRLADLYAEVESAGAAAVYAAATVAADDPDQHVATAVAQSFCSDIAVHAAEEAVQLHGGIGMTWEHPAHLYLKRAKADQIALGTPGAHRARLAELVDLPAESA
ncbi:acyl-CoA dehydrogenase [Nocardioides albidus]|uniref:Acyl-CoA dehydrogenase n=1 Tax=Nocardioides albidus TaxID=1517589 RepID=A0A5C4VL57_9ACTN|nr:acyl-CoA dehydrogenase family protein [Nocardioides albidus]TNM36507.1 acyl-CoA dehydrogenase [Nocardioides albidus]